MATRFLIFTFLTLLFTACGRGKISEDTLVKVYVENTIVQEKYILNEDSLRFHKQLVFSKYDITENEFLNELGKYSDNKNLWEDFFKKSNAYLNELAKNNKIK